MKILTQNITNIFGASGEKWLANLRVIIDQLAAFWGLSGIKPVDNMTYHYIATAVGSNNKPVVLKIGCEKKWIKEERQALEFFNGNASISLIDYNEKYNALLLQQAVPGITLKSIYPLQAEFVIGSYVDVVKKLHDKPLPARHHFLHISDWLKAIDRVSSDKLPNHLLKRAILLKNKLLESSVQQKVLHGDLHLDNILQHQNKWLTIDPKGIIGEPEFEAAAFDFIHTNELDAKLNIKEIFEERAALIAARSGLNLQRIKEWVFVRLILSAAWSIEDRGDPSWAINLAEHLLKTL